MSRSLSSGLLRMPPRRLIILGSTGSIGVSTLDVVEHLNATGHAPFEIVGLATGSRAEMACDQARKFRVPSIAVANGGPHDCLRQLKAKVFQGANAALEMVESIAQPGDMVLGAMVGSAGIPAILAAIDRGCDIALANKETLVAAGAIVMPRVRAKGVKLLPVDSEHSAIFQCLLGNTETSRSRNAGSRSETDFGVSTFRRFGVSRIILTASGGPFRSWPAERIANASVEQALNHPTWSMGPKVTIDSASLMNKSLEILEAHWLFDAPADNIDVLIHPQSIVHGLVEYVDGSVIAQLSPPDMKTPIQYALTWPRRTDGVSRKVDWTSLRKLEFEPVDHARFAAPLLAKRVIKAGIDGATSGAILNAANEVAVQAFLNGIIPFGRIVELVQEAFEGIEFGPVHTMQDVIAADQAARIFVQDRVCATREAAVGVSQ